MTVSSTVDLTDIGMFTRGEHHAALAWLRDNAPVHWNASADGGFWALTRYEDVLAAYRDHGTLSSSRGAVLGESFRNSGDTATGRMLVAADLPRHRLLKQELHPAFSPAVGSQVQDSVSTLVEQALDRLVRQGGGDFVTDVAIALPAGALKVMMDIGYSEAVELIGMTRRMIGFRDPVLVAPTMDEPMRLARAQSEIFEFFADLLYAHRSTPRGGLIQLLSAARMNGKPLPEADILYNCMNVAVGGNETSSYTACAGVAAFADNPDQYERLVAEPGLMDQAVEEILRWSSTNAYVRRVALRDTEIQGHAIREGDSVTMWNVSANRDPSQFTDPDTFDIGRSPNRHLSFGSGIHRCIGAPLGQVELVTVFRKLVERGIRLRIAGPVARLRSNFILGYTALPVEVVSAG